MRTPHWLIPLAICTLILNAAPEASAQYPGMPPAGINTQGLPPGAYNPYPRISPFENGFSQTYNKNGTWFNRSSPAGSAGRNWFMNVDFIRSQVRGLDGLVGDPNAQSYFDLVFDDLPDAQNLGFFNFFDATSAHIIPDINQSGLKLSGGFWNQDSSGFVFDVTWNRDRDAQYNARREIERTRYNAEERRRLNNSGGIADNTRLFREFRNEREVLELLLNNEDFDDDDIAPLTVQEIFEANLFNLNGIPLDNGDFGGVTQPYDMDFILTHSHMSFGSNIGMMMSPLANVGGVTLRPYVGGRYLYIEEGFGFLGIDSNTLYDGTTTIGAGNIPTDDLKLVSLANGVDDDGDFIIDNANGTDDGNGGGDFVPLNGSFITSFLNTTVSTHLAGPEFALRYDLGDPTGSGLSIYGMTKVGAMVNSETIKMRGDNIGALIRFDDTTDDGTGRNFEHTEVFDDPGDGTTPNAFSDSKRTTHISPLFEQSFQAELPVFDRIPVLNQMRQLNGARFRAGYTWTWVGHVASPNQSILWQANPQAGVFPQIRLKRDDYSVGTFNFGVNWAF